MLTQAPPWVVAAVAVEVAVEDPQVAHKEEGVVAAMVACTGIPPQYSPVIDPSLTNSLKTLRSTGWQIKGIRQ